MRFVLSRKSYGRSGFEPADSYACAEVYIFKRQPTTEALELFSFCVNGLDREMS